MINVHLNPTIFKKKSTTAQTLVSVNVMTIYTTYKKDHAMFYKKMLVRFHLDLLVLDNLINNHRRAVL